MPDSPWAPVLKKAVAKEPDTPLQHRPHSDPSAGGRDLAGRGRRRGPPHTRVWPSSPKPMPSTSTVARPRSKQCGATSSGRTCWQSSDRRVRARVVPESGSDPCAAAGLVVRGGHAGELAAGGAGAGAGARIRRRRRGDSTISFALDDPDAMASAVARWRERHDQAMLVVDQFEELFTLNSPTCSRGTRTCSAGSRSRPMSTSCCRCATTFSSIATAHEALRPVFSEITPLGPLVGGALRRALVQPASRCGYRFEDDELVDEMLAEVEGERGALPLLAFAAARLWEKRDRGDGLLTGKPISDIGGVGGALARHAEARSIESATDREPIVREIFRNLDHRRRHPRRPRVGRICCRYFRSARTRMRRTTVFAS